MPIYAKEDLTKPKIVKVTGEEMRNTSLEEAVKRNDNSEVFRLLTDAGTRCPRISQVNQVDENGVSLIMLAVQYGDLKMVTMLCQFGADLKHKDRQNTGILSHVARAQKVSLLVYLLKVDVFEIGDVMAALRISHASSATRQVLETVIGQMTMVLMGGSEAITNVTTQSHEQLLDQLVNELRQGANKLLIPAGLLKTQSAFMNVLNQYIDPASPSRCLRVSRNWEKCQKMHQQCLMGRAEKLNDPASKSQIFLAHPGNDPEQGDGIRLFSVDTTNQSIQPSQLSNVNREIETAILQAIAESERSQEHRLTEAPASTDTQVIWPCNIM